MAVRGIIAAMTDERVIGRNGQLPWHYPADLKRFKRVTSGSTIIMGRHTWESLPRKPLPDRQNIVLSGSPIAGVLCAQNLGDAIAQATMVDIWFIGGARVFNEAMDYADTIDLTYIPEHISGTDLVYFPPINSELWQAGEKQALPEDPSLIHQVFKRKKGEPERP